MSATAERAVVSGASGLVGSALCQALLADGCAVQRLVRREARGPDEISWRPDRGEIGAAQLDAADVVFHLAGAGVADGRWTAARKRRILASRVAGTLTLAGALARLGKPPRVLVQASAIGYYGDAGDQWCDEDSPAGSGFLADVVQQWEAASAPAEQAGVRVVHARIGVVLSASGGALGKMLLPFRLGLGGIVGSGDQYMSWIAQRDVVAALQHLAAHESLTGPVNLVAPNPVRNAEFTRTLGRVLGRPTALPLPAFAVRALFGEMGQEILLSGQRVSGERLRASGFEPAHAELESALRSELEPA